MSESLTHMNLVNLIYQKIIKLVPQNEIRLIEKDVPENREHSYSVKGFIPDVYFWNEQLLIIGEAKTVKDFSTSHSRKQILAYLDECDIFDGISYFILAVPWQLRITAQNFFIRMKQD